MTNTTMNDYYTGNVVEGKNYVTAKAYNTSLDVFVAQHNINKAYTAELDAAVAAYKASSYIYA